MAEKKGNEWVIRGAKNWITNGAQADLCIVFAMGDKSKGVKGINAYLVPTNTPGFVVAKNEEKLGIKASSTSQISLDEVVLPEGALLGNVGDGFKIAMSTLDGGRIGIAAQALGIAPGFRDGARLLARARGLRWSHCQLPSDSIYARRYGDSNRSITSSHYEGSHAEGPKEKFGPAAAMAKLYASEASTTVTDLAIQIHGGFGYSKGTHLSATIETRVLRVSMKGYIWRSNDSSLHGKSSTKQSETKRWLT